MKTRECPSCAMQVDAKSKDCPVCDYEFTNDTRTGRLALIIFLIVIFLVTAFWGAFSYFI